jgi:predicted nucleotidyltransferase
VLSKGDAKQLAERTIAIFAARPEVRKIVQFGSLVRGTADEHAMNTWVIEMLSTLLARSKLDIDTRHWETLPTTLQFVVQ